MVKAPPLGLVTTVLCVVFLAACFARPLHYYYRPLRQHSPFDTVVPVNHLVARGGTLAAFRVAPPQPPPSPPPNSPPPPAVDEIEDDGSVRSERSTNLSYITGTSRKLQMHVKNRILQILPDGTVNGTSDEDSYFTIVKRIPVDIGLVKIQGLATCFYLCLDSCGLLYGTKDATEDCVFRERTEINSFNTYSSVRYSNDRRTLYLALNKRGRPRKVQVHRGAPMSHLSDYTRTLPRNVDDWRVDAMRERYLKSRHRLRHHGHAHANQCLRHSPAASPSPPPPSPPGPDDGGRDRNRCRGRKKRGQKKRRCRNGEPESELCQKRPPKEKSELKTDCAEGECKPVKRRCRKGEPESDLCQKRPREETGTEPSTKCVNGDCKPKRRCRKGEPESDVCLKTGFESKADRRCWKGEQCQKKNLDPGTEPGDCKDGECKSKRRCRKGEPEGDQCQKRVREDTGTEPSIPCEGEECKKKRRCRKREPENELCQKRTDPGPEPGTDCLEDETEVACRKRLQTERRQRKNQEKKRVKDGSADKKGKTGKKKNKQSDSAKRSKATKDKRQNQRDLNKGPKRLKGGEKVTMTTKIDDSTTTTSTTISTTTTTGKVADSPTTTTDPVDANATEVDSPDLLEPPEGAALLVVDSEVPEFEPEGSGDVPALRANY